jgi:hypothetical protein
MSRNPVEVLARVGYGARGVVYALVGGLALMAALGSGGQTGGSRSALQTLLTQPLGKVWLALIGLGLLGFCAWRFVEAATDADNHGSDPKGLLVRAAHVISGAIYAGLAVSALSLALGRGGGGGGEDQAAQDWTAWLLEQPFGRWMVGAGALAIAIGGAAFLWKAWRNNVAAHLALPAATAGWVIPVGRMGYAARGVVFLMIAGFLVSAAIYSRSSQVHGIGGALDVLQQQPYGGVLLGLTAIGLFAFGMFGLVQARYRHIDAPDMDDAKAAVSNVANL